MSDYEQLQKTVSVLTAFEIVFLILGILLFITAVVLFIKFKIPNVYSEISGAKKQKQLSQMKAEKQLDVSNVYEPEFKTTEEKQKIESSPPHKRNGTVSKEVQKENKKVKRHETSLANNDRHTMVMDKSKRHKTAKQHQTVVMDKKDEVKRKYTVTDETVIINSDEIIN